MAPSHHQPTIAAIRPTAESTDDDSDGNSTLTPQDAQQSVNLAHLQTHMSHTHDAPLNHYNSHISIPDSVYDKISPRKKMVIVALLAYCSFLAPISSTAILSAIPEVAATYNTTGTIVNISNAIYMVMMGLSPCFWGPLSQVYGRRWICISSATLYLAFSIGTALAPNLAAYFVFRALTAFQGTSFLVVGSSCIGDIYRPTERATAIGWFMSGTLIGPALGPFIGGVIVTFQSWRVIFWLQTALAGAAVVGAFILLPETIHYRKADELRGLPLGAKISHLAIMINPWRVLKLFRYPNLLLTALASSSLLWNMYSLLTPIRYILNPRFHLTTPIQSGLFYLAPGAGYLTGTFFGGRWADRTVKVWIKKRNGERCPEDRLRSCLPFIGVIIPSCILIYGWSVEEAVGGIPLPVIVMFVQGVAQLFCFPSLNTYCLDVMQERSSEVVAGNYMIRYLFSALGTAFVLPAVEAMGVGWFSTISCGFLIFGALVTYSAILWGKKWRDDLDAKMRAAKHKYDSNAEDEHGTEHEDEKAYPAAVGEETGEASRTPGAAGAAAAARAAAMADDEASDVQSSSAAAATNEKADGDMV